MAHVLGDILRWHSLVVGRLILPAYSEQMRKGFLLRERWRLIANAENQRFSVVFACRQAPAIVSSHVYSAFIVPKRPNRYWDEAGRIIHLISMVLQEFYSDKP